MLRYIVAASICFASLAAGQVERQFYLEKSSFAQGEPVFLYFETTNTGSQAERVHVASPYSFCSGYDVNVTGPKPKKMTCEPWGIAGSCLSSDRSLAPGEKQVERLLLNLDHEIDSEGDYTVEAVRHMPKLMGNTGMRDGAEQFEFRSTLYFHVEESSASTESFQPWIDQLKSKDLMVRSEATRVLASLAPRSLEDVILALVGDPQFRGLAPLALHRLNTARSTAAMAEMLRNSEFGSSESMRSDQYLAETGDQQWFPLLREVAEKNARNLPYVSNAAELGGEKMLPTLLSLLSSPDQQFTRTNAVSAMSYTASRAAIPILIELLKASDTDIADRAAGSLQRLTHRRAEGKPQHQYAKWSGWWSRESNTATMHKIGECGDSILLQ